MAGKGFTHVGDSRQRSHGFDQPQGPGANGDSQHQGSQPARSANSHHAGNQPASGPVVRHQQVPTGQNDSRPETFDQVGDPTQKGHSYGQGGAVSGGQGHERSHPPHGTGMPVKDAGRRSGTNSGNH